MYVSDEGDRDLDEYTITIKKRIYPQNVVIEGLGKISEETSVYKWTTSSQDITGAYRVEWSLKGDIFKLCSRRKF